MKKEPGGSSVPPPPKLKFAPKVPPRKLTKSNVPKTEPLETKDETIDKELLMKLKTAKTNEGFRQRAPKNERKAAPAQVAFGQVNSLMARSFPVPRGDDKDTSASILEKEYVEPWDYTHSYYPVTLPLRRPYSGNPEILDEMEFGDASTSSVLDEAELNTGVELGLMEKREEPQMLFFQFPACLPFAKEPAAALNTKETTNSNNTSLTSKKGCKLEELPGGFMGKILVYKSGKVKMKLGDALFDVSPGLNCVCAQEVAAINTKDKHCCILGEIEKRVVVTPDVSSLLDAIDRMDSSY
ncbi:uncharacterized protein [Typha angustifolia]|uniref:uncharacterized protein isoform X2 n=1 Tax=Typha angustifolia TaxID=59011 RepID=UPI003C2DB580